MTIAILASGIAAFLSVALAGALVMLAARIRTGDRAKNLIRPQLTCPDKITRRLLGVGVRTGPAALRDDTERN